MGSLRGSRTEQNLRAAFTRDSEASRRYLYYAQMAEVEGRPEAARLFRAAAEGETGHALGHLDVLAELGDPATGAAMDSTDDLLRAAVGSETTEADELYPAWARTAREEGFGEIADWLEAQARAGRDQADRFRRGLDDLS